MLKVKPSKARKYMKNNKLKSILFHVLTFLVVKINFASFLVFRGQLRSWNIEEHHSIWFKLDIEEDVHYIAVLDDVFFSFQAEFAGLLGFCLVSGLFQVFV
jgi:hypothetical protein